MTQRTCNIIMCCKGHCKIGSNEPLPPSDAIAAYMSKECGCPIENYKGNLLYSILKTALIDFFKSSDNPAFHLNQLLEEHPFYEISMLERIMRLFALIGVKEKDVNGNYKYINGFTNQLIQTSKEYLSH